MLPVPRKFTDEMDIRFLRPDDPLIASIPHYNRRRVYGQLLSPMAWEVHYSGAAPPADLTTQHPEWVVMPRGFVSDGVTNWRVLWWLLPAWGHPIARAAILHDKLIELYRAGTPHPAYPNRRAIDGAFYTAARALRVHRVLAAGGWALIRVVSRIKGEG